MKFWDTSAVVPLCVTEPASATVKSILSGDSSVVVWWATRTECVSAFMRQRREGSLSMESNGRRAMCWDYLRVPGVKSKRAKCYEQRRRACWQRIPSERLTPFS